MVVIAVILLLLAAAFLLAIRGRTGHRNLRKLRRWKYAHRGLHGGGIPENSLAAFGLALEKGYGIELDLHLTKDGQLAVIHDASLLRTAGADVLVEDLTEEELERYRLEGTDEHIPMFEQVLELFAGQAPLIVELKAERGNHAALCQAACDLLEQYDGLYCIESFDPRCILWLRKNKPEIIRGQLSQNFLRDKKTKLNPVLKFALTNLLTNFLTQPDFVACRFEDRNDLAPRLCKKLWKVQGVSWTLRRQEDHDTATAEGNIPIFEYYLP